MIPRLTIRPIKRDSKQRKLMAEYESFVKRYSQTLRNLAKGDLKGIADRPSANL